MSETPKGWDELNKILYGIEYTETERSEGWWETSTGAEFGQRKKTQLHLFFASLCEPARALHWTAVLPTQPGWYWWRDQERDFRGIHHLGVEGDGLYCTTSEEYDTPADMGGEWAGPLNVPTGD